MDKTIDSLMKSTRFNYINDDSKRKIAHAAEQVMIALNGMSKYETKKTLQVVKLLLDDYFVVSLDKTEETCSK